jgi:ribose transport system ATP-binding protein
VSALAARGIRKRYGGVVALDGAAFTLERGEIHALIGANGCGKSTLCKIIAGAVSADAGELLLYDRVVSFAGPADAVEAGIDMFYQELSLIPAMTVAENIHLGREPLTRLGLVDRAALNAATAGALAGFGETLGSAVDPQASVSDLSADQRQIIEILKVLTKRVRIVILDEATAALDRNQVEILFQHLTKFRVDGGSIIFISHRIDEVFTIADRVTVMRNGRTVMASRVAEVTREQVVAAMVGGAPLTRSQARHRPAPENVLQVTGLEAGKLSGVSMTLHRGEIVGLGGLHGQGQSDFLRALYGALAVVGGTIEIDGTRYDPTGPLAATRRSLAYVSGERARYGIMAIRTIFENLVLTLLVRDRHFAVVRRRLEAEISPIVARLALKFSSLDAPATSLSGGNQQKVLIARMLAVRPVILLLDDPTKGIDLGAKAELYEIMDDLCAQGVSILLYSTDDQEMLTICDRVLVFEGGQMVAELAGEERTELALYRAAYTTGHAGAAPASAAKAPRWQPPLLWQKLRRSRYRYPYLLAAAVFLVLAATNAVLEPNFLTFGVAVSNLSIFLPLTLVAIGQTYVILGSDIDLSNGTIVSLVNVIAVTIIGTHGSVALGLAAGLGAGLTAGAANGIFVAYLRYQPIVTTFATSVIFSGLALWVLPQAGGQVPPSFYLAYAGSFLFIPTVAWILIGGALIAALIARLRFYHDLRAVGGNVQAAFQTGIPVARVRLGAYVISGLFAAFSGLALVGETASGDPLIGAGLTLSSITAVVLGGTALSGCVGSVLGSVLGAFTLGLINNVIFFAQAPFAWQGLIQGAIILAALSGGIVVARKAGD